jgi:O-antigen/teichoic acid export membrane protein
LGRVDRLRMMLLQGTRLSLAMVVLIATGLALLAHPLVMLWVGPEFSGSVPVIYILAAAVIVRVGNSTATTLLKGAGQHRLLALSNISIALANIFLSLLLVRALGLVGVALGTLIPLTFVSVFVLFPAACRRAELPIKQALAQAIWPAVWPAILMAIYLVSVRSLTGINLTSLLVESASAGLLYAALFLCLAIKREERQWYLTKVTQLVRRPSVASAV